MIGERAQAILFAEYYFALADGIFPGLECHLEKNVVLDWFGRTIKGKKNVTAFIKSNRISTLHLFTDITSISSIICNKKQRNRKLHSKRRVTLGQIADIEEIKPEIDSSKRKTTRTQKLYKNDIKYFDNVEITDYTVQEKSSVNIKANDREMNEENDAPGDLEPEITSVDNEEIQLNINELKLEEEMASTVKPIKRECGQGDRNVRAQTGTVKYIEANGQIKFTQRVMREDPWSYHWTSLKNNCWIQKCKLQIAYSRLSDNEHSGILCTSEYIPLTWPNKKSNINVKIQHDMSMQSQNKQPTLEEVIGICNGLIPDVNHFGGYLKPLNYAKDRDDFIKYFEPKLMQKNPNVCLPTVHHVENKLIIKNKNNVYREKFLRKMYNGGIYRIHKIVYKKVKTDKHDVELVAPK